MIRLARLVFILAALLSSRAVTAHTIACCPSAAVVTTSTQRNFLISAVLSRHGNNIDIQLLQAFRAGQSGDEVLGKFTRDALNLYPGYGILTTVVSELKTDKKAEVCGLGA